MSKHALRESMLARRRALPPGEALEAALRAQKTLMASPEFDHAAVVALYAPIHNEVDTSDLMATALAEGKKVLFPAVAGSGLEFRRIDSPSDLIKGAYGIREPSPACPPCPVEQTGLVVIPGVAFDCLGRRIGYGKGYYDRALHQLEGRGRLAALCYEFQIVDSIAGEPHDVLMDLIITDQRVIRPGV